MSQLVKLSKRGFLPAELVYQISLDDHIEHLRGREPIPLDKLSLVSVIPHMDRCSGRTQRLVKMTPLIKEAEAMADSLGLPYYGIQVAKWEAVNDSLFGSDTNYWVAMIHLYSEK
jgi:hypothetical protein